MGRLVTTEGESGVMLMAEHCGKEKEESIVYVKMGTRMASEHYLHERVLREVSDSKTILLANQSSSPKIEHLNPSVKQVYYQPKQLYHCTDEFSSRLTLLRPIDSFLSLFLGLHHSFNQLLSSL